MSLIHLLPKNRYFPSEFEFWDFSSVASLARNLVENYYSFFYICIEPINSEESDFRLLLLTYHLNNEKYKFYKESGQPQNVLDEFEENLPKAKRKLEGLPFFEKIDNSKKRSILKGLQFKYLSNKEIADRIPFDTEEYQPLYRFFSNQTHSTPLAFFSQNNERGRGLESEVEVSYITMALDFAIKYLLAAILDMTKLFPDCVNQLSHQKLAIIKEEFEQRTTN
ncbi:DUF5677 domain-containing protein [Roseivirga sp. 4D4]|uniref:DUF5677 domain-containing protein n=1 Tax=Roseivirga sp. 4D4 TaxID=1889784 RepID=UPI001112F8B3|nr:DUF5677 domain-containing protein [Roseivirga sp. 4D4]